MFSELRLKEISSKLLTTKGITLLFFCILIFAFNASLFKFFKHHIGIHNIDYYVPVGPIKISLKFLITVVVTSLLYFIAGLFVEKHIDNIITRKI